MSFPHITPLAIRQTTHRSFTQHLQDNIILSASFHPWVSAIFTDATDADVGNADDADANGRHTIMP